MNTHTAKVAVITRTKDRPLLLERAIRSVHNQTEKDFVHVIINDAGDPTVVDTLVEKYSDIIQGRVKVIHNKISSGMEAASNKAIKSVDSTFVAIHDDDDSWHEQFLEKTTAFLEENNSQGVVVTTDIIEESIQGDKVIKLKQGRAIEPIKGIVSLYDQCLVNYATPITFIYRRSVYDTIGYYDESLPVAGDWDFALRFLLEFDIDSLITDEALAYYHHRSQSSGVDLNSIFVDGGLKHEHNIKRIANHHLRKELKSGQLGLGYIISLLRNERARDIKQVDVLNAKINDSIKKELHYVADGVNKNVNERSAELRLNILNNSLKHTFTKRFKNSD